METPETLALLAAEASDPALSAERKKYILYPIPNEYKKIFDLAKVAQASFWTVEEICFRKDDEDLKRLSDDEMTMLKTVLIFFAGADGIVLENANTNFASAFAHPSVSYFYSVQMYQEAIHSECYSLLIQQYVKDTSEQTSMLEGLKTTPAVNQKTEYCLRWMRERTVPLSQRLVAFALVEGVFFCSSFAVIFWLRHRNLLPALSQANDLIARDESTHVRFAGMLFQLLREKPSVETVHGMVRDAVEIEYRFVDEILQEKGVPGLPLEHLKQHVRFTADVVAQELGMPAVFGDQTPLDFMTKIVLPGRANFFEKRPTEYQMCGVVSGERPPFEMHEDF